MPIFNTAANFTTIQGCAVINDAVIPFGDNFDDNALSPLWNAFNNSPSETSQRLYITSPSVTVENGGALTIPIKRVDGEGVTFKMYNAVNNTYTWRFGLNPSPSAIDPTASGTVELMHHGTDQKFRIYRENVQLIDNLLVGQSEAANGAEHTIELLFNGTGFIFKSDGTEIYTFEPLNELDTYYFNVSAFSNGRNNRYIDSLTTVGAKSFLVHDSGETDITAPEGSTMDPSTLVWSDTGSATYTLRYKSSDDFGATYGAWSSSMSLADFRDTVEAATAFQLEITTDGLCTTSFDSLTFDSVITEVDPEEFDIFVTLGQSNMEGRGVAAESPAIAPGMAYVYNSGMDTFDAMLGDPVGGASTGSCIPSFVSKWYDLTGRGCIIFERAAGGTPMLDAAGTNPAWEVDANETYPLAVAAINEMLADAVTEGFTINSQNILWCQGEQDAIAINGTTVTGELYQAALIKMIDGFIEECGIEHFFIFETGAMEDGSYETEFAEIREAQNNAVAARSRAHMIFTDAKDFPAEGKANDVHYTQEGYNEMGTTGATNAVAALSTDVTSPTVPAPIQAQIVTNDNGIAIVLAGTSGTDTGGAGWAALTVRLRYGDDSEKEILADGTLQDAGTAISPAELWQPDGSDIAGAEYFDMILADATAETDFSDAAYLRVVGWDEENNTTASSLVAISTGGGEPAEPPTAPTFTWTDNADGSGGVFTISGSDELTTNTAYVIGADGVETSAGSRTGDGVISASLAAGSYHAWIKSAVAGAASFSERAIIGVSTGREFSRSDFGAEVLADEADRFNEFGQTVTYRRKAEIVSLLAIPMKVITEYDPISGVDIAIGDAAWEFITDELTFNGDPLEPKLHDQITTASGEIFEVVQPGKLGPERATRRIPVKRISP